MTSRARIKEPQRLYWTITIAFALAAGAAIFLANDSFYRDFRSYFSFPAVEEKIPPLVRVTVDFGDGRKRAFEGGVQPGMSAFAALRISADTGKFAVVADDRGRVTAIGGVANSRAKRWQFYRNAAPVPDVPGNVEISAGDKLVFKYE